MILSPKCFCPAEKLLVLQCMWRSQTIERILEDEERMYLNALNIQVVPDSEMISLNYLPDNVPLDAKFTSLTSRSSQVQTQVVEPVTKQNERPTRQTKEIPNEARQKPLQRGKTKALATRQIKRSTGHAKVMPSEARIYIYISLPVSWNDKRS